MAAERTVCPVLADDAAAIRDHTRRTGLPATRITRPTGRVAPSPAPTQAP